MVLAYGRRFFTEPLHTDLRQGMNERLKDAPDLLVYTDGASRGNPGHAAIGYAIFDKTGSCREKDGRYVGTKTNNEAEYEALLMAIDRAKSHSKDSVKFHSDSELMVHQVNGVYQVKKDHLRRYVERIQEKTRGFASFRLIYVPRENPRIQLVDGIVNKVLDDQMGR